MSKKLESRRKLFNKFSNQLHLLKEEGLIDIELKYDKTYICPLCVNQFCEDDIVAHKSKNFLTEEDAPPDKLGGKRIALTCKDCNSKAGHQIDNHLINRIRQIDDSKYFKGSKQYRSVEFEGEKITTEITSNGDGTLIFHHELKKNNPSLLDRFIYGLKNKSIGPALNLVPKEYIAETDKVNLALLKSNYIITFARFGYIFLLDKAYNSIREQISDMNKGYEKQLFIPNQFKSENAGSYYVTNSDAYSILNVFELSSDYSTTVIGGIIPVPNRTPEQIHNALMKQSYDVGEAGKVGLALDVKYYDKNADLFDDIAEIKKVHNWIYSFK